MIADRWQHASNGYCKLIAYHQSAWVRKTFSRMARINLAETIRGEVKFENVYLRMWVKNGFPKTSIWYSGRKNICTGFENRCGNHLSLTCWAAFWNQPGHIKVDGVDIGNRSRLRREHRSSITGCVSLSDSIYKNDMLGNPDVTEEMVAAMDIVKARKSINACRASFIT